MTAYVIFLPVALWGAAVYVIVHDSIANACQNPTLKARIRARIRTGAKR